MSARTAKPGNLAWHAGAAEIVITFDVQRERCDVIVAPSPALIALSTQYYNDVSLAHSAELIWQA